MNLNKLARRVAAAEGGKVNLPIAQIKETMRCLFVELAGIEAEDVLRIVARYRRKARK